MNETWNALLDAHKRLNEALAVPLDSSQFVLDATIQRFEFTFELLWKNLQKILLAQEGLEIASPRQALQEAYRLRLIDDEVFWLAMLQDRNLTSHTYKQKLALDVYERISGYAKAMGEMITLLQSRYTII